MQQLIDYCQNKQFYFSIGIRAGHSKILSEIHEILTYFLFVKKRRVAQRKRINKTKEEINVQIKRESMLDSTIEEKSKKNTLVILRMFRGRL